MYKSSIHRWNLGLVEELRLSRYNPKMDFDKNNIILGD